MKKKKPKYMSGEEVYELLVGIKTMFEKCGLGPIELDPRRKIGDGSTLGVSQVEGHIVGVKEIVEKPNARFSIGTAMIPVVALFHEVCGHGEQIRHVYHGADPLSQILALNYYACKVSLEYYNGRKSNFSEQYRNQPHEIAAQYMGLRSARRYLGTMYESDAVDGMLVAYVNERMRRCSEFIWHFWPYKDNGMDKVLDDFEDVFKQKVTRHRKYSWKHAKNDILHESRCVDEAGVKFVETCSNGICQDMYMVSVYLFERDPNDILRKSGPFKSLNLYPSDVQEAVPLNYSYEDIALSRLGDTLDAVERYQAEHGSKDGKIGPST